MWCGAFFFYSDRGSISEHETLFPSEGVGIEESQQREAHAGYPFEGGPGGNIMVARGEKKVSGGGIWFLSMVECCAGPVAGGVEQFIVTG